MDEEELKVLYWVAGITAVIVIALVCLWAMCNKDGRRALISKTKEKLNNLKNKFEQTHPEIAEEIKECLILIANNLSTKAVSAVFKIVENGLKSKLESDKPVKAYILLDNAKKSNLITKEEYALAQEARVLRNEEAHELAVRLKQDELKSYQNCYSGLELIEKIYK